MLTKEFIEAGSSREVPKGLTMRFIEAERRRSLPKLYRAAIHEAGHALIALLQGARVEEIMLFCNLEYAVGGLTHSQGGDDPALILVGGVVAEAILQGKAPTIQKMQTVATDYDYLKSLKVTPPEIRELMAVAHGELLTVWPEVERVGRALYDDFKFDEGSPFGYGVLTADEIRRARRRRKAS